MPAGVKPWTGRMQLTPVSRIMQYADGGGRKRGSDGTQSQKLVKKRHIINYIEEHWRVMPGCVEHTPTRVRTG
jgi:hypothetical protein